MRPELSPEDLRRLASLARLDPSQAELHDARRRIAAMLGYFERLRALDLAGVEPLTHVGEEVNRLDDDTPGPTLPPGALASIAPALDGPFIAVPKVLAADPGAGA